MSRRALQLRVTGRVQGVGFRWFVVRAAEAEGVDGFVRNLGDGSVEVRAEGPEEALERLVEAVRRGPGHARVASMERTDLQPSGEYRGFGVRFDSGPPGR